jgi:hypothetical protein
MYIKIVKTDGTTVCGNLDNLTLIQKTQGEMQTIMMFNNDAIYVSKDDSVEFITDVKSALNSILE